MTPNLVCQIDRVLSEILPYSYYERIQRSLGYPILKSSFRKRTGYALNLSNPLTFNEKCIFRLLHDRNPLFPLITDKVRVRDYVKSALGEEFLIPSIGVYESVEEIPFNNLPGCCILKTNFMSGGNILVDERRPLDVDWCRRKLGEWMKRPYGRQKLLWFAQEIPRRIIIEELLRDRNGFIPSDIKLFCFGSKVRLIEIHKDRFDGYSRGFFDINWNPLNVCYESTKVAGRVDSLERPHKLSELIEVAETLSAGLDFVRVDLYLVEDDIYFGEMTLSPVNGMARFHPSEMDAQLGMMWKLSVR